MSNRQYYSLEALIQSPKGSKGWFAYSEVKPEEAQWIQKKTGLDVTGFIHTIERDAIVHILNGHGEVSRENEVPITEEDILSIPKKITSFDHVKLGDRQRKNKIIIYTKRTDSTMYLIEEVRMGRKTLSIKTRYKNKVASEAPGIQAPGHTSETTSDQPPLLL